MRARSLLRAGRSLRQPRWRSPRVEQKPSQENPGSSDLRRQSRPCSREDVRRMAALRALLSGRRSARRQRVSSPTGRRRPQNRSIGSPIMVQVSLGYRRFRYSSPPRTELLSAYYSWRIGSVRRASPTSWASSCRARRALRSTPLKLRAVYHSWYTATGRKPVSRHRLGGGVSSAEQRNRYDRTCLLRFHLGRGEPGALQLAKPSSRPSP
jgi:hypothetical protein